ncbi:unnamed protein product [Polarella glacialis]|uniref:Histidine phosphatase family protein n=1 Tax=Polarella glacialis TaxID=89957 RepID=A0A813F8Z1_POLGL|nr:unnamed protein product [Polarella glacialis]
MRKEAHVSHVDWQTSNRRRRIILIRHGERADGPGLPRLASGSFPGDPALSAAGALQAELSAARIRGLLAEGECGIPFHGGQPDVPVMVCSSPARRCLQTGRALAAILHTELRVEPGLADWSGQAGLAGVVEAGAACPDLPITGTPPPLIASHAEVRLRDDMASLWPWPVPKDHRWMST